MDAVTKDDVRLEFTTDPAAFLAAAGDHLADRALVGTVMTTVTERAVREQGAGARPSEDDWWLVVRDGAGEVVGAAMRTAPFAPRPIYLMPMPDAAAVELARALHERGEEVLGVNGALPAAELCAEELARLTGGTHAITIRTRLHVLDRLIPPRPVPGRLVPASPVDIDLVETWFAAFFGDADEQAGRERGFGHDEVPARDVLLARIESGDIWFWLDEDGRRVHLTGANAPTYGVARVGPVYTPPEERGRGWASNAVAEVSRRIVAQGARACLFTDQANPTSNRIYAGLGYRPVIDMADVTVAWARSAHRLDA